MNLAWDPVADSDLHHYNVYIGTAPGQRDLDVQSVPAPRTTLAFTASPGVLYYFTVSAVNTGGTEGPLSEEIPGSVPLLYPLSNRTSVVNVPIVTMYLSAADPDGGTLRFSHVGLPVGLTLDEQSGVITGTPTSVGAYNVTIFATDGLATSSQSFIWTVMAPIASLRSDVPSPQMTGTPITFTASANGGTGSYQFKWWLWTGSTWTMVRDWGSATYTWTPMQSNPNYRVGIWARDATSTADSNQVNLSVPFVINSVPAPSLSLVSNVPSPQIAGTAITFTATAAGGAGSYQFKWWLWTGSTWTMLRDWGSATYTWTPTLANANYRIGIWARDASSTTDSNEFNLSVPFVINGAPLPGWLTVVLTSNMPIPQVVGTPITFAATASGGTGWYQFKWWLWDGYTWTMLRDWSGATLTWTPSQASPNYRVGIWARDASSTVDSSQFNMSIPVVVGARSPGSLSLGLTSDVPGPQAVVGSPITFTATATGGTGSYQFKWWLWDGVTWTMVRDWSSATFSWTPPTASLNYRIGMWARDSATAADSNQFNLSIAVPILP